MSAPHFFTGSVAGDRITIGGDEAHHAARVLRIRAGEAITISDGRGVVVDARCVSADARALVADVVARRVVEQPAPILTVFPAVPKAGKLELVIQKLTELGVDRIAPWIASRSVARWDAAKVRAHGDRWRAVAFEAAKQSRRAWLPEVLDPLAPDPLPTLTVVLHEEQTGTRLGDVLRGHPAAVGLIVGPEGGLTDEEVASFVERGAQVAGLGPQILRTETASIVGSALVLSRWGRLG